MLWTNTKRVIRAGFINFWRNGFVSLSSVLVMIITLFVLGSLVFMSVLLNSALIEIKDKVDINVYFVTGAQEEDVLAIKSSIEALPEVREVTYLSPAQVVQEFRNRHENDGFNDALDELPDNPFGAMLNIKAVDPSHYADIATFIESKSVSPDDGLPVIDSVNYRDRELIINRLTRMINSGQQLGIILMVILILISVMITFNTIRLAIYISRDEISVMRLVGASSKYIRGPFVIIGIMYGIFAAIITALIFLPTTYYLGKASADFFQGVNIYSYYLTHFPLIFLMLAGAGAFIGAVSSYLAVRRYLSV